MALPGFVRTAVLAAVAVLAFAQISQAAEAVATTALNVRSGPGTGFAVVDTLAAGEVVEMTECQPSGWCYITHTGPDGWVNAAYLTAAPAAGSPGEDCSFQLTIGPSGPQFSIVCGGGVSPPADPPPPPVGDQACFYNGANFTGAEFCYAPGTLNSLNATFNDRISSVRLFGEAKARVCVNTNLGAPCRNITSDVAVLGPVVNNRISSVRVYTGLILTPLPTPLVPLPAPPVTHSTGPIDLPQTYMANLDNGAVTSAGADIWYHAITATNKRLDPRTGARLTPGDGTTSAQTG